MESFPSRKKLDFALIIRAGKLMVVWQKIIFEKVLAKLRFCNICNTNSMKKYKNTVSAVPLPLAPAFRFTIIVLTKRLEADFFRFIDHVKYDLIDFTVYHTKNLHKNILEFIFSV